MCGRSHRTCECTSTGVRRIRRADQFNPSRQIHCTIFSSTTFPTVYSSATAWLCCLSRKLHCIRPCSGQGFANSALGSKSLATPALLDRSRSCFNGHAQSRDKVKKTLAFQKLFWVHRSLKKQSLFCKAFVVSSPVSQQQFRKAFHSMARETSVRAVEHSGALDEASRPADSSGVSRSLEARQHHRDPDALYHHPSHDTPDTGCRWVHRAATEESLLCATDRDHRLRIGWAEVTREPAAKVIGQVFLLTYIACVIIWFLLWTRSNDNVLAGTTAASLLLESTCLALTMMWRE